MHDRAKDGGAGMCAPKPGVPGPNIGGYEYAVNKK
jgi:hypothetical protein